MGDPAASVDSMHGLYYAVPWAVHCARKRSKPSTIGPQPCGGWLAAWPTCHSAPSVSNRFEPGGCAMLFPTTLVGSYPQPDWLIDREKLAGRFPPRVRMRELWRIPEPFLAQA